MSLRFLTLYKDYLLVPRSCSSSSDEKSPVPPATESWVDNVLYDPPAAPGSPSSSTVCLPGTPRHGPLIDFDEYYDNESEQETERIADEVRRELTDEEFIATADGVAEFRAETAFANENATMAGMAAGRGLRDGCVSDEDTRRRDLLRFYDVDEDAVELTGELKLDEGGGALVETLFDSGLEAVPDGLYTGSDCDSDDSWCTTDDIAASPTEETPPVLRSGTEKFVSKWLGLGKKPQPNTVKPSAKLPDTELLGLVNEEAAEWARVEAEEVSETDSFDDKASTDTESSSLRRSKEEFDSVLARMEAAEEGRAIEMGPLTEMRCYGDGRDDDVEYVVVDRPSLDFLDRLDALEGATLRKGRD